jgi:hypothetical protein
MNIGGHEIVLREESPVSYDVAWRYHIAQILADGKSGCRLPAEVAADPYIGNLVRHLRGGGRGRRSSNLYFARLCAWNADDSVRIALEAFLLTEATYETIAAEMGDVKPEEIRDFGAVFFDVRDDKGCLISPTMLRLRFCLNPDEGAGAGIAALWRKAALSGGYRLVQLLWGNFAASGRPVEQADPEEIVDLLVEQEIAGRVLSGGMGTRDLIQMRSAGIARQKLRFDMGDGSAARGEGWEFARKLLEATAPKPPGSIAPAAEQVHASAQRRSAEGGIAKQEVVDLGPAAGVERMRQLLRVKAQADKAQRAGADAKIADGPNQMSRLSGR